MAIDNEGTIGDAINARYLRNCEIILQAEALVGSTRYSATILRAEALVGFTQYSATILRAEQALVGLWSDTRLIFNRQRQNAG